MGSIIALANSIGVSVESVAGLELVRREDTPALLAAFASADIRILGIEGFRRESHDKVRPAMDAILDLSDVNDPLESVREAERFVDAVSTADLLFEFVIAESG